MHTLISFARGVLHRAIWPSAAVLSLLLVGVAAIVAVVSLQRYVEGRENELLAMQQLESDASALSLIEWQAIADGMVDADTAARFWSASDRLSSTLRGIGDEPELQSHVATYRAAAQDEMTLVAIGHLDEARQFDTERVDPAFESVLAEINTEQTTHRREADRARLLQQVGAIATIVATMGVIGVVMLRLRGREMRAVEHQAIAASEARFRSLARNSSDMIAVVDAATVIRYASPASLTMLGRIDTSLTGTRLVDLVHPGDAARVAHFFAAEIAGGDAVANLDVRIHRADGSWRAVEIIAGDGTADPNVGGFVLNIRDVGDRKALEERLRYQAFHDPLTTLANRLSFSERLQQALAGSTHHGGLVAVLFLDLDEFKSVNDVHGHPSGDQLLVEVGMRLRACLRPEDMLARFGGDEFAILLEDAGSVAGAKNIAGRILDTFLLPFSIAGTEVFSCVSIGIAVNEQGDTTADELLRQADIAMYVAKGRGKNRSEVFVPAMQHTIVKRLMLANDLEGAIERGEFVVYYQPTIALADGRVVGMEALVRWRHPERGLLAPHEFIGLAEETGLIRPMGRWVLNQACAQLRAWQHRYPAIRPLDVAVNVSVGQVHHPGLAEVVADALTASGLPPESLILEITESVVVEDADLALQRLRELKRLGVRLAIDDFGTGYSSLDRLRRFPVDFLKIDKSFIDKIRRRGKDHGLARTIIELGKNLGMEIVAEGIERPDQLALLRSMDCNFGQGYLFGRPMPAEEMESFLSTADALLRTSDRAAA